MTTTASATTAQFEQIIENGVKPVATLPTTYGTYEIPGLDCLAYYDAMSQMWVREDNGQWIKHETIAELVAENGYTKLPDAEPAFRAGRWYKR